MPHAVLCAKSLTALTLHECKLESTTCCGDINLPSLKKLSLTFVYVDDQVFQNLVSVCPVIEDMKFGNCRGIKSMKSIFILPKVMAITVTQNDGLESWEAWVAFGSFKSLLSIYRSGLKSRAIK